MKHVSTYPMRTLVVLALLLGLSTAMATPVSAGVASVVIGESMTARVIPYAQEHRCDWYAADPELLPEEWMEANRQWIRGVMDQNKRIITRGPDPANPNYPGISSAFFQMEVDEIAARGYTNVINESELDDNCGPA